MSKHRLYFELNASNENFREFLWIRSYVWIIPLSNRYIHCSFLGFELSLCLITSLPGNTSLTFVTSDSQFSCKQISTKSLVTTTSHSMKSAPSSIASCKENVAVLRFIYTERKQMGKRILFFDLCYCSMWTLNWILYEPIWKGTRFRLRFSLRTK